MAKLKYGIIGHPVKHSLSPAMQNAAFHALGIDAEYLLYDVEPEKLEAFLKNAADNNISGLNITIPHKIKAKEFLERKGTLDENARRLGAVNTVKIAEDGSICGYNTDGPGFYRSLIEELKFEPEGKNIFVLGAGGAAHAIVMYLGNSPKRIYVSDIDKAKIDDLRTHYKRWFDGKRLVTVGEDEFKSSLKDAELLINTTPIGMRVTDPSPIDPSLFHYGLYIYDLVYNRPSTEMVKKATSLKLHAVTGTGMLLHQGAIAFEIWTGAKAPVAVMKKALKEALKSQA
ncbi:MAG: shikimate dehydrogenase [Candidatus Omnitrophica bacterium]|nr:shikimate dehydrogenase [Candidatus Omnitrophota bacterium]MDD5436075.1 shikimate dehydrogenase [Candidatus Omnitrophota bacterium]